MCNISNSNKYPICPVPEIKEIISQAMIPYFLLVYMMPDNYSKVNRRHYHTEVSYKEKIAGMYNFTSPLKPFS